MLSPLLVAAIILSVGLAFDAKAQDADNSAVKVEAITPASGGMQEDAAPISSTFSSEAVEDAPELRAAKRAPDVYDDLEF